MESITIPASVTCIGGNVFSGCSSLGSIEVNDNNLDYASADGVLFKKNNDGENTTLIQYPAKKSGNSYKIPNTVTSIKDVAFEGCSNLSSVTLGNKITSIGNGVFKNCSALVNIEIPKTVKSIESYAFSGCNALERVTVDGDLNSVGEEAFSNCPKLSKFEYKGNYAPSDGGNVFDGCNKLGKISVSKNYQGEYKFCGHQTNFKPSFWNADAGTGSAWFFGVLGTLISVGLVIKDLLQKGKRDKVRPYQYDEWTPLLNSETDDPPVRSWAEFLALGAKLSAFIKEVREKEVRESLSSPKGLSPSPASKDTSSSGASSTSTAREGTSSPKASSTGGSDL